MQPARMTHGSRSGIEPRFLRLDAPDVPRVSPASRDHALASPSRSPARTCPSAPVARRQPQSTASDTIVASSFSTSVHLHPPPSPSPSPSPCIVIVIVIVAAAARRLPQNLTPENARRTAEHARLGLQGGFGVNVRGGEAGEIEEDSRKKEGSDPSISHPYARRRSRPRARPALCTPPRAPAPTPPRPSMQHPPRPPLPPHLPPASSSVRRPQPSSPAVYPPAPTPSPSLVVHAYILRPSLLRARCPRSNPRPASVMVARVVKPFATRPPIPTASSRSRSPRRRSLRAPRALQGPALSPSRPHPAHRAPAPALPCTP
ncbi:hypothetical protein B0H15DRAFT_1027650, partial [Mycena belliarum]